MSETPALFALLATVADPRITGAIERLVASAPDQDLCRVNVFAFAVANGLDPEATVAAFLHAASIGLFDMSWNVLCPGCGGVLDTNASLKTVIREEYVCALCAEGYEPSLDELVEVTFTVSPRVRRIAAHDPGTLPLKDYLRQIYWGSGVDIQDDRFDDEMEAIVIDTLELGPGEKGALSVRLPARFIIVFEVVTHTVQFIDVKGEPTTERQALSLTYDRDHGHNQMLEMHPGPLRLAIENRTDTRVMPAVLIAGEVLHDLLGRRRPFLTAKHLLTNQTFRDLYRTDTLTVDQRLKITSLTFLFTDLRGSTELYERVGDLAAFDLVREHFQVLHEIVTSEAGAVVKTIGDAVMATFATPDRAIAAAIRMRDAMRELNARSGREDLLLKIGMHEGPCIAVSMNERQDYFGQTVNIASRVQGLADERAIYVTGAVVSDENAARMLAERDLKPARQNARLRGIERDIDVYAIP
ncbi:MAG: adenylate/guanylate cyclase domain-containing protein [Proteobacteria bacterium]|nr:adenylate/guanylate cyclase domain-containing protein [Pseudomonadota bacterium]MBS0572097.1 adenylate/guanylate cyclase domain-containing protein [Pseudomonadota bacterium]